MSMTDHAASPSPHPPPALLLWVSRKSGQIASFRAFLGVLRVLVFFASGRRNAQMHELFYLQRLIFTHAPLRSRPWRQRSKGVI